MKPLSNRWLVIRNGAVGDTLLLSPTIQLIRQNEPNSWIEVLGIEERVELLIGEGQANAAKDMDSVSFHSLFSDGPIAKDLENYLSAFTHILYYTGNPRPKYEKRLTTQEGQWVRLWTAIPENDTGLHITKHYAQSIKEL